MNIVFEFFIRSYYINWFQFIVINLIVRRERKSETINDVL